MSHPRLIQLGLALTLATGCSLTPTGTPVPEKPRGAILPGQIMVSWKAPVDASAIAATNTRLGASVVAGEGNARELLQVPAGQELDWCRRYAAEPGVSLAEPNYVLRSQQVPGSFRPLRRVLFTPNDSSFTGPGQTAAWGLRAIHADSAWDVSQGDPRVTVAVIDTGVDMNHPDLAANLDKKNAINLVEKNQPVDDDFGHGTHVAGIIAAVGNDALGSLGVAWKCKVMPIRVLGVDGTGSAYDTIDAIDYAVSHGAKVINMSLGSPDRSAIEGQAVQAAIDAGVVVVAAAGNEATDGNYLEFPSSYPGVVSVAAVDQDLKRAPFSNYNSRVTLAAPGVDILSTIPSRFAPDPKLAYGYLSGTSMATPFVSGAAALVFATHPGWTGAQVIDKLRKTARDLSAPSDVPGPDVYFGDGLLDAAAAVQ